METKAESDMKSSRDIQSARIPLLATDLHLELDIIHHRASLKLLQLNAGQTDKITFWIYEIYLAFVFNFTSIEIV